MSADDVPTCYIAGGHRPPLQRTPSVFLLVVGIDVLGIDDVVLFSGLGSRTALCRTTGLAAGLRASCLVHRLSDLMRCLGERVRRLVDPADIASFQGFLAVGDGGFNGLHI